MDKFIIKRDLYGLHKRACCFLIALLFLLLAGCGEQTKETDSKKDETAKNSSKAESSEATESWREDEKWQSLTKTWVSLPTETDEQKMVVIYRKIGLKYRWPDPIKIENFINTPQNLYATVLLRKEDVSQFIGEEWRKSEEREWIYSLAIDSDLENKPEWYDITSDDYEKCIAAKDMNGIFTYIDIETGNVTDCWSLPKGYAILETDDPDVLKAYFYYDNGLGELANHPECYGD